MTGYCSNQKTSEKIKKSGRFFYLSMKEKNFNLHLNHFLDLMFSYWKEHYGTTTLRF